MGEYAINLPTSSMHEHEVGSLPPQIVARWAAIAAERSVLASLPEQVHAA